MKIVENDSIILPNCAPIVSTYMLNAAVFLILPNYPNAIPWLYNNFVNIMGYNSTDDQMPIRFSSWDSLRICPFLFHGEISHDMIASLTQTTCDFIIKSITNGYYIFIPVDEFDVPLYDNYLKTHFMHKIMIYGFDNHKKEFIVADFFKNRKFSFGNLSFDILEVAAKNANQIPAPGSWFSTDSWLNAILIKYNNIKYSFDKNLLVKSIRDYINAEHNILGYEENIVNDEERSKNREGVMVFGVGTYPLLQKYILENQSNFIDIRPFQLMYDHKVLMLERLNYLNSNGYLSKYDSIVNQFKTVENICLKNRGLLIKYMVKRDENIKNQIIDGIDLLKKEDTIAMTMLLEDLSRS